jgi:GT2 family glycosyltransferase
MLQDVFVNTGHYYDDGYFMYFEDMDLWMRAQLLGWRCLYEPAVVSYHKQSAIAGAVSLFDKSEEIVRCAVRNRFATMAKNLPLPVLLLLLPVLIAVEPLDWLRATFASTPKLRSLLDGYISFVRDIPHLISQRHKIQNSRRVSVWAVLRWFRLRLR